MGARISGVRPGVRPQEGAFALIAYMLSRLGTLVSICAR